MPTVTQDLDIWALIVHASFVVKVVMVVLLAVSFMSWMFIFQKWFVLRRAVSQTLSFEREFWGGKDLNALYQGAVNQRHTIGSLERVFEAGYREFAKLRSQGLPVGTTHRRLLLDLLGDPHPFGDHVHAVTLVEVG